MGVRRSIRILQTALGCGVDGWFGPITATAAERCDAGATVVSYCRVREGIYKNLVERNPRLGKFLKGWLKRLNSLRREAGLPGPESAEPRTRGGEAIARIPDLGEDQPLEQWQ